MAKLGKFHLYHQAETRQVYSTECETRVYSDGTFTIEVPAELVQIARNAATVTDWSLEPDHGKYVVRSRELAVAKKALSEFAKEYLACEVKEEMVIVYDYKVDVSYVTTPEDPTPRPNGVGLTNPVWHMDTNRGMRGNLFAVHLGAKVRLKKTYSSNGTNYTTYERPARPNFCDELYLDKLNNFAGVNVDEAPYVNGKRGHPKQVPYTEEAAKFFYDAMIGMCKLAQQVEAFFAKPESLIQTIENRGSLMLPK